MFRSTGRVLKTNRLRTGLKLIVAALWAFLTGSTVPRCSKAASFWELKQHKDCGFVPLTELTQYAIVLS